MSTLSPEERILAKFEENMRKNEAALSALNRHKKSLEEKEDAVCDSQRQLNDYLETHRDLYAGTEEGPVFYRFDEALHEEETKIGKLLAAEKEELAEEEKQLYAEQEEYQKQRRAELSAYYEKGAEEA